MNQSKMKRRALRYTFVAAVAGAMVFPMVSQHLRAQGDIDDEAALGVAEPAAAGGSSKAVPLGGTTAPDVDPATVVARAGEVKVTAGEFQGFLSALPPQAQQQVALQPGAKRQLAEELVKMKVLAAEAERRSAEDPALKAKIEVMRTQALFQAMLAHVAADQAGEREYFDAHGDQFGRVKARHILVGTRPGADGKEPLTDEQAKKKADDIRARLVKGEDFAATAKAESDDPGSKDKGGSYEFGRGEMVPAFEQTAYALKENEISQPVKTDFGYHVIQLEKRLPAEFEKARPGIARQRVDELVKRATGGAETEFNPAFFGEAAGPAGARGAKPAPKAPEGKQPAGK